MEDVTDIGFRKLCKRFGAAMTYTEFVSAEALVRSIKSTIRKLEIDDSERPVGIQIYGRDVPQMVEAAQIVEEAAHPDVIDLNFGCPVKKVAGKGAGAGMLQNIPLLLEITRSVVKAVNTPVTVKTRLGWNADQLIITTLAEQLQDCGIKALTIHGRTRSQMYTGEADWTLIGEVKRNPRITIPIIGNGDITSPQRALQAFERYGVDAIMVGRATFGRPWIFKEINDYLKANGSSNSPTELPPTGEVPLAFREGYGSVGVLARRINCRGEAGGFSPSPAERFDFYLDILIEQLRINIDYISKQHPEDTQLQNEYRAILHTRRHLAATPIFKGIPDFRQTRIQMLRAETVDDLLEIFQQIRQRFSVTD